MNRITKRLALPVVAAAVLGTSGYAFMASNTVPATFAGQGGHVISGSTVSNVHYLLKDNGTQSSSTGGTDMYISGVEFTIDHPMQQGQTVYATVASDNSGYGIATKYANCTGGTDSNGATSTYTCTLGSNGNTSGSMQALRAANYLQVIAAQ